MKLPFWKRAKRAEGTPNQPPAQGVDDEIKAFSQKLETDPEFADKWLKEVKEVLEESDLGRKIRLREQMLLSDPRGPEDQLLKDLSSLSDLELLGFAYQCQTRSHIEAFRGGARADEREQLMAQGASPTAIAATDAAERESTEAWITWISRRRKCNEELARRCLAEPPPVPAQVFADSLVAYAAYLKRLANMRETWDNEDGAPHKIVFQSGLHLMFTRDQDDQWHLSLSRHDGPPSEEETEAALQAFFGGRANVTATEGVFKKNVRHFYKADAPPSAAEPESARH